VDDHRKYPLHAAEPPLKWIITENTRWGGSPPAAAAYPLGPPLGRRRISGSSQRTLAEPPLGRRRWMKWIITENTRCKPAAAWSGSSQRTPAACRRWATDAEVDDHREHSLHAAEPPPKWIITENTRCMPPSRRRSG
jgi:hypothetical protein